MTRSDTTAADILAWVVDRLQANLSLSGSQCFLTADSMQPPQIPPTDVFLTVSPGGGQFAIDESAAGHLIERWTFRVRVFVRVAVDRADRDGARLLDAQRGLLTWKQRILRELAGADNPAWNLRGWIAPVTASEAQWLRAAKGGEIDFLTLAIDFQADFDWDIA